MGESNQAKSKHLRIKQINLNYENSQIKTQQA